MIGDLLLARLSATSTKRQQCLAVTANSLEQRGPFDFIFPQAVKFIRLIRGGAISRREPWKNGAERGREKGSSREAE